jgi:hypothetical protein
MAAGSAAALAGCGGPPATGITPAFHTNQVLTSATDPGKDPDAVVKQVAAQLHTHARALRTGLTVRTTTTLIDERQACQVGGDWPAQWIFDQRLYLTVTDARPAGHTIAQRFAAQGWDVHAPPSVKGADQYTSQREGFVISLGAASDDGSLNIQTSSPCVDADGTLTTPSSS